jgi:DNA polymerase IV
MRIRKAQERGALWVKEWRDGITHVVVDRGLTYADVIKYLKVTALPVSTPERVRLACSFLP